MAGAAGSFVTRSFELMLKEATGKKYNALQKALKSYLDSPKQADQKSSNQQEQIVVKLESDSKLSTENVNSEKDGTEQVQLQEEATSTTMSVDIGEEHKPNISNKNEAIAATLANTGHTLEGGDLELVLQPLRLAFETKNPKVVEPALDCLHKLIAYEHLEGDVGIEGGKNCEVFTDIINLVCGSVENSALDSTILQVLKVLLTSVASTKFRVHGECSLSIIRTCYSIALNSKSPVNQATSKAMLTQIISIVYKRMETDEQDFGMKSVSSKHECREAVSESSSNEATKEQTSSTSENVVLENKMEDTSVVSVEELQQLAGGADIKGLEAVLDKVVQFEGSQSPAGEVDLDKVSIWQRDALLVFRTLCKTAMKEETDEFVTKTKLLSLELLQGLLEGVSSAFTQNFHFIDSVKAYLSYALLRACVSSSSQIFQLSTNIFCILLLRFRESLKAEIGIFFSLVILRSLDSSDSPIQQRTCVLRMLEKVCRDSQMLADIFVNYDCDLEATNLFERMVSALSRIAQGTLNTDPSSITLSQNTSIKASSLQCLVNVLKSLVHWADTHQVSKINVTDTVNSNSLESFQTNSVADDTKMKETAPSQFEKAKAHKSTMEAAIAEFNRKPDKGINLLVSNMLVEKTPSAIAKFLRTTAGLDKVMIGDYLGQHEDFPIAVMHAYVDEMNFSGMKFDKAIREFLKGFRLPGEAQKIDRIMEKFAERYCQDNPGLFKNADTAYVLAYAVIMLNTDAHNPTVWPKMSKADFVRMNSSTEAEECAPKEMLEEIYDSVVTEEIKMKDESIVLGRGSRQKPDSEERGGIINILNLAMPRLKVQDDTKKESEEIVKRTQAFFKRGGGKRGIFYTAQQMELVRPMLEAVGWPLLAAFSVTMEDSENRPRVVLCMEGFRQGIYLARVLGMDTMRYAFLTSLVRFTFLHAPKEMRSKNVEALRTLLLLCEVEPHALQDTWNAVLECVSRLEFITSSQSISLTVSQGSNQITRDALLGSLRELTGKPMEQVFLNSVKLPSDTIVEFFTALCGVSAEELKQTPARVFSLQKLVEISYYNMARIRMVWARIWSVLSHHFIAAGSHHDEKIAMYAIDSLRQLGMKYLEREELAKFTFQNDILKPFVVLMRNSRSTTIRNLIVDCIVQMIKSKVGSIKSGWRSVFMVFTAAAADETETIAESAFENVEQVVLEHFDQVVGDCFMDCVNCLIGFANNKSCPRISLKAIALLRICEDRLAEGLIPGGALKPVETIGLDYEFDITEHYWFPMLAGLSELTSDPRIEVRNCALEVLFDLLKERGHKFSPKFWENVFHRVLFPIFDNVRHTGKDVNQLYADDPWLRDTCIHSLQLLCDLFSSFYKDVSFMLPSLLGLLLDCAKKPDQTVASISCNALVHLIKVGGHQFNGKDWETLLTSIRDVSYTTQPLELLNTQGFGSTRKIIGMPTSQEIKGDQSHDIVVVEDDIADRGVHDNGNSIPMLAENHSNGEVHEQSNKQFSEQNDRNRLNIEETEGITSASADTKATNESISRNQTFGQKMMDALLLKNLTFKSKTRSTETQIPAISAEVFEETNTIHEESEDTPLMKCIRGKCLTQLLLLNAIDSIQKNHWEHLQSSHKLLLMEILFSMVDFASSYNSYSNLRLRMHQVSLERLPANILRQEIEATRIYLDVLHRSTLECVKHDAQKDDSSNDVSLTKNNKEEQRLKELAEQKLVSFCGLVLKEASDLQSGPGEAVDAEVHRTIVLRSPIIVKVLSAMCNMNKQIFKRHLGEFFPSVTKLVCSDQMEVRRALGDLFKKQLSGLLP